MNTQKRVNERLQKIAFKNQKVDLSLISDIDRAFDRAISAEKNLARYKEGLELDAKTASNDYQIVINLGKKALQQAKDLGADDIIRVIQSRISDAEVSKKEMDSIVSKAKSMLV
jgi:hypothetical protein